MMAIVLKLNKPIRSRIPHKVEVFASRLQSKHTSTVEEANASFLALVEPLNAGYIVNETLGTLN